MCNFLKYLLFNFKNILIFVFRINYQGLSQDNVTKVCGCCFGWFWVVLRNLTLWLFSSRDRTKVS